MLLINNFNLFIIASFLLNAINSTNEGYVSEGGHVERWVGGIDKEKMTKEVNKAVKIAKENINKKLND